MEIFYLKNSGLSHGVHYIALIDALKERLEIYQIKERSSIESNPILILLSGKNHNPLLNAFFL